MAKEWLLLEHRSHYPFSLHGSFHLSILITINKFIIFLIDTYKPQALLDHIGKAIEV